MATTSTTPSFTYQDIRKVSIKPIEFQVNMPDGTTITQYRRPVPASVLVRFIGVESSNDQFTLIQDLIAQVLCDPKGNRVFANGAEVAELPVEVINDIAKTITGAIRGPKESSTSTDTTSNETNSSDSPTG